MKRLAILGPGLLGGSVALAARERQLAESVALWARRPAAIAEIESAGAVELASVDLAAVLEGAEIVVLATPVGAIAELLKKAIPLLAPSAVVTDLCSVKGSVEALVKAALSASDRDDIQFIGAHPMAGSDLTGFAHARADLFEGAACAIVPPENSTPDTINFVREFWTALGCRTVDLEASEHDLLVARISHLPHVAASALVRAGLRGQAGELAGAGFRDSTRVASGPAPMWAEILSENRQGVSSALADYIAELTELLANLREMDNEEVLQFLADARRRRQALYDLGEAEGGVEDKPAI